MKFFDPKKKENHVVPSTDPNSPQPAAPVSPPRPAPQPVEPAAPTVSIPVPPKPPEKPPQPVVAETKPAPAQNQRKSQTLFGPSVVVKGDVKADETLIIDGVLEGSVVTSRDVFIGSEGKVQANIQATNVIISGKVKGDIIATNKVELGPYSTLEGNIRAPRLTVSESSVFRGSIRMNVPEPGSERVRSDEKQQPAAETPSGTMEKEPSA